MFVTFQQPEDTALQPLSPQWPQAYSPYPLVIIWYFPKRSRRLTPLFSTTSTKLVSSLTRGPAHCLPWSGWLYNLTFPIGSPLAMSESLLFWGDDLLLYLSVTNLGSNSPPLPPFLCSTSWTAQHCWILVLSWPTLVLFECTWSELVGRGKNSLSLSSKPSSWPYHPSLLHPSHS